jgi:hypothetical protein
MARYRAIVSVEFDDEDLQSLAESIGADNVDPNEGLTGELDNFGLGTYWIEQIFRNGIPTIHRLTRDGIQVTINDHDLDDSEDEDDEDCYDEDEDD